MYHVLYTHTHIALLTSPSKTNVFEYINKENPIIFGYLQNATSTSKLESFNLYLDKFVFSIDLLYSGRWRLMETKRVT